MMSFPPPLDLLFSLMLNMADTRTGTIMTLPRLQDRENYERLVRIYTDIITTEERVRRFAGFAFAETDDTDRLPEHEVQREGRSLTFYSDGSYTPANGLLAAAIAFQDAKGAWRTNVGDQHDAELFGVCLASRIAVEKRRAGDDFKNITIYSDSKKAVEMLMPRLHDEKDFPVILGPVPANGKWTFEEILDLADELASDTYIHVRWIKGHNGITGNAKADKAAKTANMKQDPFPTTSYPPTIPDQYMGHGPLLILEYAFRAGIRPLPILPEETTETPETDEIDALIRSF